MTDTHHFNFKSLMFFFSKTALLRHNLYSTQHLKFLYIQQSIVNLTAQNNIHQSQTGLH